MPNFPKGGKNSLFEKDFKLKYAPLKKKLTTLELKLQKIILLSLNDPKKATAYWNKVRKEIELVYKQMNIVFEAWAQVNLPKRYIQSLKSIDRTLKATASIIEKAKLPSTKLLHGSASRQIVQALYREAVETFTASTALGMKNVFTFTRLTQQALISEGLIDVVIAEGFSEGNLQTGIGRLSKLFKEQLEVINGGQYVQAGRYKYKPSYYAEMVGRVKFHDAHSEASLSQARNYGTDLVQVSSHNTTTEICMQYEGKVFSISGTDKRFPPLTASPPYHPNCLHLIYPTFESAMEVQGTLEKFSDFSKGRIDRPPTPASFIPAEDRVLV